MRVGSPRPDTRYSHQESHLDLELRRFMSCLLDDGSVELSPWDSHPAAGDTKPTRPLSLLPAAETRSAVAGGTPSDAARNTLELKAQSLGFAPRTIRLTAGRSTVELGLMGSPRIALGLSGFQPGTLLIKLRALDSLTRSRTWISTFAEWCPVCWTMRDNPPWTRTTIT